MVVILVLLTIVTLVAWDLLLTRRQPAADGSTRPRPIVPGLADGLFLHPGHGWVQVETGGRIQIGVDGFVRGIVGTPERVLTRPVGAWLKKGQPMLTLENAGRQLRVPAPLTGRVEAINPELAKHPSWWAGESGTNGWAYTLRPACLGTEIDNLRVAESAAGWLRSQMTRLSAWLADHAMAGTAVATLPDGGTPVQGALSELQAPDWQAFEQTFLPAGTKWSWEETGGER